jgi:probable rRNA maturation factor
VTEIFFEAAVPAGIKKAAASLKRAAALGLGARNAKKHVNLVLTGGPGIKSLNRRFLGKDRLTDVIAFNLPPAPVPGSAWGEIYVCVPVAARQASAMGHSLLTELLVLTAHGALHLSGMDDSTPELRRRMNERTARLLRRL